MKRWDLGEWVMFTLTGAFGAFLGFVIYFVFWHLAFFGLEFSPPFGSAALFFCPSIFGSLFLLAYIIRDNEFESGGSGFFHDQSSALLIGRRLTTILTLPLVVWFIWELFNAA